MDDEIGVSDLPATIVMVVLGLGIVGLVFAGVAFVAWVAG